jgi:hypothetical protein
MTNATKTALYMTDTYMWDMPVDADPMDDPHFPTVALIFQQGGPCYMCGSHTCDAAVFEAENLSFGVPKGKILRFVYRVCRGCECLPNHGELIGARLLDGLQEFRAAYREQGAGV